MPNQSRSGILAKFPEPYWWVYGAALYHGHVIDRLRDLPARSVQCVITSPPYWGLRDYGNGDDQIGNERIPDCLGWATGLPCGECFVCHMVQVFREVHRVLRDDGTLWLNLGDTYAGSMTGGTGPKSPEQATKRNEQKMFDRGNIETGIDKGNLVGVPWRTALALQADGWILRNDIVWSKSSQMPESVENRCTKSHEYIHMFTKKQDYFFDYVAIQEDSKSDPRNNVPVKFKPTSKKDKLDTSDKIRSAATSASMNGRDEVPYDKTNKRDVWVLPTANYKGGHFATFSSRLITPCILSGTSEHGCCAVCYRPWERLVVRNGGVPSGDKTNDSRDRSFSSSRNGVESFTLDGVIARKETGGWRKMCGCRTDEVVPCLVLDPFVGTGTTVATSLQLGRHGVGIDLSEKYLREDAIPRIEKALTEMEDKAPTIALVDRTTPVPKRLRGS